MRIKYLITILVLLVVGLLPAPAQAGGVVTVCDEAHLLAALAGGGTVTFACSGTITLTNTITIAADTTIDGSKQDITISGNNTVRLFTVNEGGGLHLNELTVANGSAANGGGIHNSGMLTVSNSSFSGNQTTAYLGEGNGGGILNNGMLTVSNSAFSDNDAGLNAGGGIFNSGMVTVRDTTFSGNEAGGGGAIANSGTLLVSNSTISGNGASAGGGIENLGVLTVTNCTFSGNGSQWGGAIDNRGMATLQNSAFHRNGGFYGGGAIFNGATMTVSSSTFAGGFVPAGYGGGILNYYHLSVDNCTFTGNHAMSGGGIQSLGWTAVINSTISGNGATIAGGGVAGEVRLANSIVANSTAGGNCDGPMPDDGGNLSYPDTTCPGINADPLLGPLQDNGGPTWTMEPGPGSPAIDAGDPAACAAGPVDNLDQRGVIRPVGPRCDMGAVEVNYLSVRTWLPLLLVQ